MNKDNEEWFLDIEDAAEEAARSKEADNENTKWISEDLLQYSLKGVQALEL